MHQSPRIRRLHNDLTALDRLRSESSVFKFSASGNPPQTYVLFLHGKGLYRENGKVKVLDHHRIEIKLGASYPRTLPELRWLTPIYHPNISEIGMVCLGGYGTHWVPSIQLDELCVMLWDMLRYHNYDIRSPYNREAALWTAGQTTFRFPLDARPLRDLRASQGRVAAAGDKNIPEAGSSRAGAKTARRGSRSGADSPTPVARVLQFIERYSRVFGESAMPDPAREQAPAQSPRSRPEFEQVRQLIERSAGQSSNFRGVDPVRSPVTADTPIASTEVNSQAPAAAPIDQVDRGREQDEMIILETSGDDARAETGRPSRDDEVFFIT